MSFLFPCFINCLEDNNGEWYETTFFDIFELYPENKVSIQQAVVLNQYLSHKVKNVPILELFQPDVTKFFQKDFENLQKGFFKWEDIEIPAIEKRAEFIKQFNVDVPDIRLSLLNTEPFEKLISLKFLDMITETPNYTFGQPIYNNSLNLYTFLLKYFITFYLRKDFLHLEKIDAEDIETYSPIARHYIRENNREEPSIRRKYFNEEFNLVKFAIKLVEKFVVGATWRWIGGNHKAHVYCIEVCKIIVECGIASSEECHHIRNALYLKLQVFRGLETIIDKDSKTIAMTWIDKWYNGLLNVREYYIEILINTLYLQQDNEVLAMLLRVYKENKKSPIKNEEYLKNFIKFNKSVLFEEEFARKIMDFLLSYILSQNKIADKTITSRKIENISDNFLHIFSNYDDPYLHTLKLIREQDYMNFCREENKEFGPNNFIKQDFQNFVGNLKTLINQITQGVYLYKEIKLIKDIEEILDSVNGKVSYLKATQNNEARNFLFQRLLFCSGFPSMLFNLIANLMEFSEALKAKEAEGLLMKFKAFIEYYLKDNQEMQSSFFRASNFSRFEKMFYKFPAIISTLLLDVFKENSQILISKEDILKVLLDMFKNHYESSKENVKILIYNDLSRLIDTIALFINLSYYKIFNWIPEYDIRIAMNMTEYPDFFNIDDLVTLMEGYESDKSKENDAKLDFLMNYFSLLQISTSYRYPDAVYKKLDERLSIDNLIKLIQSCKSNINFRSIFLELYGNIHIDFKNHLINNRSDYYFTKPADLQYEEDPFFDKQYDKTIDMLIGELKMVINEGGNLKNNNDLEHYFNFINSAIFGNIAKLINYFMVIKEEDL